VDDGFIFCFCPVCVDDDIVHVDRSFAAIDEFHQFVIYHGLKGRWGVGQTKEHDSGFEESIACFEGGLPFVTFFDTDVVISPADVELGKPLFARDAMDEL